MGTRLVSILGLGPKTDEPHYLPVRYGWEGRTTAEPTPLVQAAMVELDPDVSSVALLGTRAVKARWWDTGLAEKLLGVRSVPVGFWLVEDGATSDERWDVFNAFSDLLKPTALEGLETKAPARIRFDVTHGFRLQPMLGLAALSYAQSEAVRAGGEPIPISVSYGAFEARDESDVAPIWDLTEFLTAGAWNSALDALVRYGRADELHHLTQGLASLHSTDTTTADAFRVLGERAKAFSDEFLFSRVGSLFRNSARALDKALNSRALDGFLTRLQMLDGSLGVLQGIVKSLAAETVVSKEGLGTQATLARELFRTGQYASAAVALREGLVDMAAVVLDRTEGLEPKRQVRSRDEREKIEERLKNYKIQAPELHPVGEFWDAFRPVRNDILHGGRDRPRTALELRAGLEDALEKFEDLVKGLQ